jgi:hypothetical protein
LLNRHGAEGVLRLAADHRVDRRADRAGGAQCRLARGRRDHRVWIEVDTTGRRYRREHRLDVVGVVDAFDLGALGNRCFAALDAGELGRIQRLDDRLQAAGRFGMIGPGGVLNTDWMRVNDGRHGAP